MPSAARIRSFFRNLFSTKRLETDLEQEIQTHIEMMIEEKIRGGMEKEEARRASMLELGGKEQVKERVREARIGQWLQSVISDCRYGMRQIRKSPSFSIVAVITLALAICA